MRPTIDLAYRARNWFWYWRVREISGLSNDFLDRKCFGNSGRRRHFERIQVSASSPNEMPLVDGKTLLDLVDRWDCPSNTEPGPYETATQEFNSQLWTFLATRDLPLSIYTDYINQYAEKHGWTRIASSDWSLYTLFLGEHEPAVEHGVSMAYSAMLHKLVNEPTPDSIAMLIALFKEAMDRVNLEKAIAIRSALRASVFWLAERTGLNNTSVSLIINLVNDRVIRNQWFVESDWKNQTKPSNLTTKSSRDRVREFQAWINWYIGPRNNQVSKIFGEYPLVPRSERTDWVEEYYEFLLTVRKRIAYLESLNIALRESISPNSRQLAEDSRIEADEILSLIQAPDTEPKRFYTSSPDLIIQKLPRPYPLSEPSDPKHTQENKD